MYVAEFIMIHEGVQVEGEGKPHEVGIKQDAEILAVGVLSAKIAASGSGYSTKNLKFWRRFRDTRSDGWYIGRDRWDAVIF